MRMIKFGIVAMVVLTALTLIVLAARDPITTLVVQNSSFAKAQVSEALSLMTALALIAYLPLLATLAWQSTIKSDYIQELKFLAKISVSPERAAADLRDLEAGVTAAWGDLTALTQNEKLRNAPAALDLVSKASNAEVLAARYRAITARLKILTTS